MAVDEVNIGGLAAMGHQAIDTDQSFSRLRKAANVD
jgi:hypothetical protein